MKGPRCADCAFFIRMYEMPKSVYMKEDVFLGRCSKKERCMSFDDASRCPFFMGRERAYEQKTE